MEKDILIKIINDAGNVFYERKSSLRSLNLVKKWVVLNDNSKYIDVVNFNEIIRTFNK